jgi:hypothetical protein
MPYSQPSDLYAFGVPRGATPNPGRVLDSAASPGVCSLDVHGFATGDPIFFRPAGDGAMPAGLVEGTTYYAEELTEHSFAVRETPTGVAIGFATAADPIMVGSPLPFDESIAFADRVIDEMLPAHLVPFADGEVPEIIRMTSAEIAAAKLLGVSGAASVSLSAMVDAASKRLERWAKGATVRGAPEAAEKRTNRAAVALSPFLDRRGWTRFGGI